MGEFNVVGGMSSFQSGESGDVEYLLGLTRFGVLYLDSFWGHFETGTHIFSNGSKNNMNYTQYSVFLSLYFFYLLPFGGTKIRTSLVVRKDPHLFRDTKIRTSLLFRKDPHLWHLSTRQLSTRVAEQASKDLYN